MANGADIVGYVLLGGLMLIMLFVTIEAENALKDPNNTNVVYLEQLPSLALLAGSGEWLVTIYRQSGNVHSATTVRGDASAALQVAMTTMRRAKIDSIGIRVNEDGHLYFNRLFHNHRGRNEGKKVGGARIQRT